jgi:hypothetical protein
MMQGRGPIDGVADSLDETKAAFRATWERPLSHAQGRVACGPS